MGRRIAFRAKGHAQTLHQVTATIAIGQPHVSLAGRYPTPWQYPFGEQPRRPTAWRGRWSLDQIAAARSSCRSSTPHWLTGWAWARSACACTPGPADRAIALEHNGDVYSCDRCVEDGYLLGNIADGRTLLKLVTSPGPVAFGSAKLDTLPEYCRRCDVRFACNGGCPKDRFISTPDGDPGPNYLCAGYQRFFRHIDEPMRIMADLLRHDRDAAAIRDWHTDGDRRASPRPDDAGDPARRAR